MRRPNSWFKLWMLILMRAQWRDNGRLKRGQCWLNYDLVSRAVPDFGHSNYKKAMAWLHSQSMIVTAQEPRGVVVTVCNWDRFQQPDNIQSNRTSNRGVTATVTAIQEEEDTREHKEPTPPKKKKTHPPVARGATVEGFDQFWASYPLKVGKLAARRAWVTHKCATRIPVMLASLEKHKASSKWKRDGGQYIPHPTTYLNQGREFDEIDDGPSKGEPESLDEHFAQRKARQVREEERAQRRARQEREAG